ncbi:MAG: thiol reductase thioredoxin, partial [Alistipes sp.]
MKKTLFLLMAALSFASCMGQQTTKNDNQKSTDMKTVHLTKAEFVTKVANLDSKTWKYLGDKPALIDFYASW